MALNKRVKKSIVNKYLVCYSQNFSSHNAIFIIGDIGQRNIVSLIAVVDIRSNKFIEKRLNIIVVNMQTIIVADNINRHIELSFGLIQGAC